MQSRYRVLSVDLRGQGDSEFPDSSYSNHSDMIELLDELGVREAYVIGLSAGAQVALDMALSAPKVVRAMILVSPSLHGFTPKELPPFLDDLIVALRSGEFQNANRVLLESSIMSVPPENEELVRTMVNENSRLWTIPFTMVEQPRISTLEVLNSIRTPSLVLAGKKDLAGILEQAALLEQSLPNVSLVLIEDGGHLLNLTSSEAFNKAVDDFLSAISE